MHISIRKFLLINLLLAIAITTSLTAIGNYYLDQKDIERHLDTLMAISTLSYQALLGDDLSHTRLADIQQSLNDVPKDIENYYLKNYLSKAQENFANKFNFQVWSKTDRLLLHSVNAPKQPLSGGKTGFSDKVIDGDLWRVFTAYNADSGVRTMLGEHYDTRNELGHLIAQDDIYIMLLTFPLSGLLIWIIIGRGLNSLNRIAKEVANRAPTYLDPVGEAGVPIEIKPVIDELNELFARLQEAFNREKRFAADAAHELRTPLAALKTQAQVALDTKDPEERESVLKNVILGADRCGHTVQQLLTLSRLVPQASYLEDTSRINLAKLAADIIAQIVPAALEKHIDIELENGPKSARILGNVTALSILLRNLIDNSIRYTPEKGEVKVSIKHRADKVLLIVADTGPGIPIELRSRVFERFFRVLGTKTPGSGLGLAIVQQIAKLHRAEVVLGSPPWGKGLAVTVIFPDYQHSKGLVKHLTALD